MGRCCHFDCLFHVKLIFDALKPRKDNQTILLYIYDWLKLPFYQSILNTTYLFMEVSFWLLNRHFVMVNAKLIFYYDRLKLLILLEWVCFFDIIDFHIDLMCVVDEIGPRERHFSSGFYKETFIIFEYFDGFISGVLNINRKLITWTCIDFSELIQALMLMLFNLDFKVGKVFMILHLWGCPIIALFESDGE